jgi:hypothetical protein
MVLDTASLSKYLQDADDIVHDLRCVELRQVVPENETRNHRSEPAKRLLILIMHHSQIEYDKPKCRKH